MKNLDKYLSVLTGDVDGLLLTLTDENLVSKLDYAINNPELCETLRQNVLKKQLDHPEDLKEMLSLIDERGGTEK